MQGLNNSSLTFAADLDQPTQVNLFVSSCESPNSKCFSHTVNTWWRCVVNRILPPLPIPPKKTDTHLKLPYMSDVKNTSINELQSITSHLIHCNWSHQDTFQLHDFSTSMDEASSRASAVTCPEESLKDDDGGNNQKRWDRCNLHMLLDNDS